jgi:cyclohexadienyl dehydratase
MGLSFSRLLAVLLLVVGAACTPTKAPTSAAPRPAAALTVLHAGTSGDYPPLSVWKNDHAEGYAPELLGAFASSQKNAIAWTRFTWPGLASDLREGRFEIAADGITVRPERSVIGRFTVPIARGGAILLVRRPAWLGSSSTEPLSLRILDRPELRVVVNRGGHLERVTRSLLHAAKIEAIPDNAAVGSALARGEADAAMTNTFEAPRFRAGLAGIEQVGPLTKDITALWVRADQSELAEHLDDWLLAEEASGRLDQLRTRALGPGGGGPTARPVDALIAATAERLALMPFVAAAKQSTAKSVEDSAQEQRVLAAAAEAVGKAAAKRGQAPPPRERINAFFRAQIEAAKNVQEHAPAPSAPAPTFSLDRDLRPAIARITARMAFIVVRLPRDITLTSVRALARDELANSGLDEEHVDNLARALAALTTD